MKMQRQIRLQRKAYRKLRALPESEASISQNTLTAAANSENGQHSKRQIFRNKSRKTNRHHTAGKLNMVPTNHSLPTGSASDPWP